jgi:hypothetical protein
VVTAERQSRRQTTVRGENGEGTGENKRVEDSNADDVHILGRVERRESSGFDLKL